MPDVPRCNFCATAPARHSIRHPGRTWVFCITCYRLVNMRLFQALLDRALSILPVVFTEVRADRIKEIAEAAQNDFLMADVECWMCGKTVPEFSLNPNRVCRLCVVDLYAMPAEDPSKFRRISAWWGRVRQRVARSFTGARATPP